MGSKTARGFQMRGGAPGSTRISAVNVDDPDNSFSLVNDLTTARLEHFMPSVQP